MAGTEKLHEASANPATYFAPAERATEWKLKMAIEKVSKSPVVSAMLETLGGWVAILNKERQVLAVNHGLLKMMGIPDPAGVLGLRPGEMLHCAHAHDHSGGCGTGRFCVTCGAAIAIVAAQRTCCGQQRECVLTIEREGALSDHVFVVNCSPFELDSERLLLICMRDVSAEKRRMALERTFLHDVSNVLTVLGVAVARLDQSGGVAEPALLNQIREASETLSREVRVQRLLGRDDPGESRLDIQEVRPGDILKRIEAIFARRPVAEGQSLVVDWPQSEVPFETDIALLVRVLLNMVINAFEAGEPGDQVRIGIEEADEDVTFYVWNRQAIPESVSLRVFQRYFSTKEGDGRGWGTFAMKLLGEALLKGKVSFSTSQGAGTTFRIRHPRHLRKLEKPVGASHGRMPRIR